MKKLFTTPDYKRRNTKRSVDAVKKKRKRENKNPNFKPAQVNATNVGMFNRPSYSTKNIGSFNRTSYSPPPIVPIVAPTNFSLIYNTEETLDYFEQAHKELKKKNRILFDISGVTTLTTDAIAVQIAKIKDHRFHFNSGIIGNAPNDETLNKLFLQSGFYEYVNTRGNKPTNNKKILIHEITNNKVEPDKAKEAYLLGLRHTFQNEEIFEPLYNILIEIMQNTNNHAGLTRGKYDWWLHVYNHPDSMKTSYTFLDLGVGIFESLPVKSFKRDFLELLGLTSNLDLVPKLFAGEIKSRTSRPERGKGIPQVYECSQHKYFEKFFLISNDIYANLKTNENRIIKNSFNGTLFYWELNNI